ncbi:hypothetical protein GGS26DRAFT_595048 [Hypomontagnella submonticulosa]|nr:hypothetical protein GGS26DRAFT_595048 [Hypomontagnella submonticulosa]
MNIVREGALRGRDINLTPDTKPDGESENSVRCSGQIRYDPAMNRDQHLNERFSCLCGGFAGSIVGHVPIHRVCHCHDCKKLNGGNPGNYLVMPRTSLWFGYQPSPKAYLFQSPGGEDRHKKWVMSCPHCSAAVLWKHATTETEMVFVFASSLEDPRWMQGHRPDQETYLKAKTTMVTPFRQNTWYTAPEEPENKPFVGGSSSESSVSFTYRKKRRAPTKESMD